MIGDLHIVDWSDLLAIAHRKARIGTADIGEKNISCLADTHDHLVAATLQAARTFPPPLLRPEPYGAGIGESVLGCS
jgi:hypothetical protein